MIQFTKYPSGNVWSSGISTVTLITDSASKVSFALYCGDDASGDLVFENGFFAVGSSVVVSGLGNVLSDYMRAHSQILQQYTIKATVDSETDQKTFTVCYCDRLMPCTVDLWAANRYLTSAERLTIPSDGSISLTSLCASTENKYKIIAVGKDANGNTMQCTLTEKIVIPFSSGLQVLDITGISPAYIIEQSATTHINPIVEVRSFTINHGSRSMTVFVVPTPENSVTFKYQNIFNVQETITIAGTVKKALDLTRSEAVVSGVTVQYDITGYRTYEITSAPMTQAEAARIEALVTSRSVVAPSGRAVLITSTDYSYDTDSASLKSVTLAWRYASQYVLDETDTAVSDGIFSDPFSYQYS